MELLAAAKRLEKTFLNSLGVGELKVKGVPRVAIPYMEETGEVRAIRYRLSLNGAQRFIWRKGDRVMPYGLWRLPDARQAGWCLLVEGESDCWTAWAHRVPALGLPGASTWRPEWAEVLEGVQVYLWAEPDSAGQALPAKVVKDIPGLMVIRPPKGFKDLSQAHIEGQDVPALVERLKAEAVPAAVLVKEAQDTRIAALQQAAASVLAHPDPMDLVRQAVVATGYGGDPGPVLITYLALTSRLLAMRHGSMPVHLLLVGPASAGKSFTLQTALLLMPESAVHVITAGSPRALIYDETDLKHRAVVFGEADSLPAGEDNPAASAIRALLQDHELSYDVTVKNPDTGQYTVKKVRRAGPTVLITTSTRRLGHQLDTRIFTLAIADDPSHLRQALETQGRNETGTPPAGPDPALIAFQELLQALAPWEVVVPFATLLAKELAPQILGPRILRDYSRLLSLIKAVAILRHAHRRRDAKGRVVAEVADYITVYELCNRLYAETVGVPEAVREVVAAVEALKGKVSVKEVADHLGLAPATAWRRVKQALRGGWLSNAETRKGYPAILEIGEDLPPEAGLPAPETISAISQEVQEGEIGHVIDIIYKNDTDFTISRLTAPKQNPITPGSENSGRDQKVSSENEDDDNSDDLTGILIRRMEP
ncbi:MAG: hypothetical protein WHT07_01185 [Desulfobaccales bacterium]